MTIFLKHIEVLSEKIDDRSVYPFSIPALRGLEKLTFNTPVTFLIGENGSGKSTLIEAIAIKAGFNAEGGTKNFRTTARPSESRLHEVLRVARGAKRESGGFFLRAESMFNIFTEAEGYQDSGWEVLHEKSHGEAFLWIIQNRFNKNGLFILDEPEAALSPQRQLACLSEMHRLVKAGCQFIVATHSPILMAYPGATILQLDAEYGPTPTKYEDTEHYRVTKGFLQNPVKMLKTLLEG